MLDRFTLPGPIGELTLVMQEGAIIICEFSDEPARISRQLERYYRDLPIQDITVPRKIRQCFEQYFKGEGSALEQLTAAPMGTPYQQSVWRALATIPAGSRWSYAMLAEITGSHPRAVGSANGRNPVALIIPCHRVIGKDGSLTGYAGGLDRKQWLLRMEGA